MPHIHTKPGQHDVTVSAWILKKVDDETKVFVHMHRKMKKYIEIGGHMELDETPWQTMAHELEEESGYTLDELDIYQPSYAPMELPFFEVHPVPSLLVTYQPSPDHFHSDICYVFSAKQEPCKKPAENESSDVKWFSIKELEDGVAEGVVVEDIVATYKLFINMSKSKGIKLVSANKFSLDRPLVSQSAIEKSIGYETLEITRFGNPVLRKKAKKLTDAEIHSEETQMLIKNVREILTTERYGVGLAAPQVGKSLAMSVIGIKPTPNRPNLQRFDTVIINPGYEGIGKISSMWEGCISCGTDDDTLFAQVPRYEKVKATWLDDKAKKHEEILDDFVAHVFQHETDHLEGILFVDKVKDTNSFMMADEYRKRIVGKNKHKLFE